MKNMDAQSRCHGAGHLLRCRSRAGFRGAQQPRGRRQALHELLAQGVQADDAGEPDGNLMLQCQDTSASRFRDGSRRC